LSGFPGPPFDIRRASTAQNQYNVWQLNEELQKIVDALSGRVLRDVVVDDPRLRLLAHSAHHQDGLDPARLASILTLSTPADVTAWLRAQGVLDARGPVRIPANDDLGMKSRVCFPVRANGALLGFIWMIELDPPLGDEEMGIGSEAAEAVASVLYRRHFRPLAQRNRERDLMLRLLSPEQAISAAAAKTIEEEGLLKHSGSISVMVVKAHVPEVGQAWIDATLPRAMDRLRRALGTKKSLFVVRDDHGVAVLAEDDPALSIAGPRELAAKTIKALCAPAPISAAPWSAGFATGIESLAGVRLGYGRAQDAALVAHRIRAFHPVADWGRLGPYRYLATLAADAGGGLPEAIEMLLELPSEGALVETLECFLDYAGDVKLSADALSLHRASLYYRLKKIEQITCKNLKRGDDRLELQLGLKLARLQEAAA
jgi:hypothetical protein